MSLDNLNPGCILKIKATDFVSYSLLNFRPTESVNILLAPNGAGKSSLLSAIVLGLGGKPGIIGKSNQIADFIMYGKDEAKIRIDLCDLSVRDNILKIGRVIKRNGTSVWFLNKKKVALKQVEEVMNKLNIQVDSLCQVLPQERVGDFAKMNSLELLTNVQKVIDNNLYSSYCKLVEFRQSLSSLKETIEKKTLLQQDEIVKYERLEKDVEAIIERKRALRSVGMCRKKLAWVLYKDKEEEQNKVSKFLSEAKVKLENYEKDLEPLKKIIDKMEKKCSMFREAVKNKKNNLNADLDKLKKTMNAIRMSNDQIEHIKETLSRRILEASNLQSRINEAEARINELAQLLSKENDKELMENVNRYDLGIKEKTAEMHLFVQQENQMKDEHASVNQIVRMLENKLDRANSVGRKRLEMLSRMNRDVHTAYKWVDENKHQFQSNIYGPILMELNISISKGAKYVEFIISMRDLISFVTETTQDLTNLLRVLRDKNNLNVNCAHCDPPGYELHQLYPPPIPLEEIKKIGFDCYLIDLVEGPPTILKHLCNLVKLHMIPVAFSSRHVDRDILGQYHHIISAYFIDHEFYKVSQSRYSKQIGVQVLQVKPARLLADSLDKELIHQTQLELNAKREALGDLLEEISAIADSKKCLQTELNELRNKKKSIAQRLEQHRSTTVRMRRHEEERRNLLNSMLDRQKEEKKVQDQIRSITASNKTKLVEVLRLTKVFSENSITCKLSKIDYDVAKKLSDSKKNELMQYEDGKQKLKHDLEMLKKAHDEVQMEAVKLFAKAKESTDGLKMGEADFKRMFSKAFSSLPDDLEGIKNKIHSFEAKAKCLDNPMQEQNLRDYEAAKKLAENLGEELERMKQEFDSTKHSFDESMLNWLPKIEKIVFELNSKFSSFFQNMNCVGDVRLNKTIDHEAVDQFGLEIRVKFRSDTELQLLDQYVQSGGERALTTAVFLLTLQKLSHLPFRCVDEINQGMDEFNERRVYKLLFNTISNSSSQYFLLTPKFLRGVPYPKKCRIFNIYNAPLYKIASSPVLNSSSQHSQALTDINLNGIVTNLSQDIIIKDEQEKENSLHAKRKRR